MSKSQAVRDYLNNNPSAAPKDVISELSKQGVDVSYALVTKVKSRIGESGGGRPRKSTAGAARAQSNGSEGTSKAQAIRDAFQELGNGARPRDVIAALSTKGIPVSSAQVSMVRKAMGMKRLRRRRGMAMAGAAAPSYSRTDTVSVADLIAAKQLADQMGGVKVVRKALETLERLA